MPKFTTPIAPFPASRPRRQRRTAFTRDLVREHHLSASDLIWPVFVHEGAQRIEAVPSMPGVSRLSLDALLPLARECAALGIPAIALFPVIDPSLKTPDGAEALNPDGLVPRIVQALKQQVPGLGVLTDVALDPYTSHGQDGVLDANGRILNDETVAILKQQALVQAAAGVDIVAPSDMMDGRVGAIRQALEAAGLIDTQIMAYSAKYASAFYGPFRDAAESPPQFGDRRTYQMDYANADEALREVALDIDEGADIVMVKPAFGYQDLIWRVKEKFRYPVACYNVSGEYAMVKAAAQNGWLDEKQVVLEMLTGFRRSGADIILTYWAQQAARWLNG